MPTDERDVVHASKFTQAGFTIIPNVVMTREDLSPLARLIYGYLKHLAWKNGDAVAETPLQVICRDLGAAENTVRKAISELRADNLVQSKRRGQGRSNQYVIHEPKDDTASPAVHESHTAEGSGLEQQGVHLSHSPKEEKSEERENASHSLAVQGNREAPKQVKIEGRNLGFDALVKVTMANPKAEGSRIAKALALIRDLVWDELLPDVKAIIAPEQFEQVIADAIKDRAKTYERTWPNVELTPTALSNNWSRIVVSSTRQKKYRPKGGLTPEAILAMQSGEEEE